MLICTRTSLISSVYFLVIKDSYFFSTVISSLNTDLVARLIPSANPTTEIKERLSIILVRKEFLIFE
ncbi:hypothetical protein DV872_13040 [Oceanispirochaeta sp. M1]|nr:hypothetical protein DV872_13040 [Oceanispirochaeta sp. M1]